MEIEDLLDLIELILTQKDGAEAFTGAISKRKFCLPYFDHLLNEGFLPDEGALLVATQMRQIEIVRFILEHGVRPTLESFQYAADNEFFELCSLFVEFGSRYILSTPELERKLKNDCFGDNLISVKNLINRGVDFTVNNNSILKVASQMGKIRIIRLLLKHGADANVSIRWAVQMGHIEVIRLLLEHGVNTSVKDLSFKIMSYAPYDNYIDIMRLLLKYGADSEHHRDYIIQEASKNGNIEVVRLFLEYGIGSIFKNKSIQFASKKGHTKIVELLEEYGAKL
jgi:ankyrin repeat protein